MGKIRPVLPCTVNFRCNVKALVRTKIREQQCLYHRPTHDNKHFDSPVFACCRVRSCSAYDKNGKRSTTTLNTACTTQYLIAGRIIRTVAIYTPPHTPTIAHKKARYAETGRVDKKGKQKTKQIICVPA